MIKKSRDREVSKSITGRDRNRRGTVGVGPKAGYGLEPTEIDTGLGIENTQIGNESRIIINYRNRPMCKITEFILSARAQLVFNYTLLCNVLSELTQCTTFR
ncbi:hypothetical protein EVAR_35526_1 [Eumeta japonica]|uniref:Uncharacterized protein n=1 Tax=Eumeta variegata TaxID=151549 RepID=A0A4C1X938_EUMVA|nr:hypothetical protein EVAR_35526_1 [Eumeta japonica]